MYSLGFKSGTLLLPRKDGQDWNFFFKEINVLIQVINIIDKDT